MLPGLLKQKHLAVLGKASTLLALVVLCGALAQLILQLLSLFAPPVPTPGATVENHAPPAQKVPSYNIASIRAVHLFGTETLESEPVAVLQESTLDIRVKGVLLSQDSRRSMAFLYLNGESGVYQRGDRVNDDRGILLESVREHQVVIRYRGQLQSIPYEPHTVSMAAVQSPLPRTAKAEVITKPVPKPGPGPAPRSVTRVAKNDLVEARKALQGNPALLGQYVNAVPHQLDGKIVGFKVTPGQDGALFRRLGLQADDILLSINKLSLVAGANLPQLGQLLASADSLDLEIERKGVVIHKRVLF